MAGQHAGITVVDETSVQVMSVDKLTPRPEVSTSSSRHAINDNGALLLAVRPGR